MPSLTGTHNHPVSLQEGPARARFPAAAAALAGSHKVMIYSSGTSPGYHIPKLHELMRWCDELEKRLSQARESGSHLLDALLNRILHPQA